MFVVHALVVGVKLNVSYWMNSLMNATLKPNVSLFLLHLLFLAHLADFVQYCCFFSFSAKMRSVAV